MSNSIDNEIDGARRLLTGLTRIAIAGGLFAIAVLILYFGKFHGDLSPEADKWGQFGDYIGGILNPLFSFLALLALLATFAFQVQQLRSSAREVEEARATAKRQNFEASFFQMLRLHNEIVLSMDLVGDHGITKGRDCLRVFRDRLVQKVRLRSTSSGFSDFEHFLFTYEAFHSEHEVELGHYFRLLYTIVKFVKETPEIKNKRFYTNIIRAQLSSAEVLLIFYNCLSQFGSEKFKPLVEEFSLLKTISKEHLPEDMLLHKYAASAYGGSFPHYSLNAP
jgi:hypothetical protein